MFRNIFLKKLRLAPQYYLLVLFFSSVTMADTRVIIIRHGEKPAEGLGQLSCKGFNRSLALGQVLEKRFGKPDAIVVPNPGMQKPDKGVLFSYIRPLATVEPMAISLEMPVEAVIAFNDLPAIEARIDDALSNTKSNTLVVAWEHKIAEQVAKNIAKKYSVSEAVPHWEDDDFDSIYVFSKNDSGKIQFHVEQQGLNHLSKQCKKVH